MLICFFFLDSAALSKAAAKNKKRAEKRRKERIQQVKENGGRALEAMEMKDPVSILREQLQEAKNNQVRCNLGFWETTHLPLPEPNILPQVHVSVNVGLGEG